MIKNSFIYLFVFASVAFLFSCKTEVDLRGPYEDKPIVFGLLDQSVDTQYIKINKSFIGDGNNFDYAGIPDCTVFKSVVGTVTEVNSGTVYDLKEKYVKNLQDGIFYTDSQKVYYFVPVGFDENSKYQLNVSIDGDRKKLSSETDVVKALQVNTKSLLEELKYYADDSPETFGQSSIRFFAPKKEMLFSVSFRFYYDEYLTDNSITRRYIEYNLGDQTSRVDNEELEFIIQGETFFAQIPNDNHIKNTDISTVKKRVVRYFSYHVSAANQELTTYINLNQPNSSIAQETPSYTNIEGGLGVFASRYSVIRDKSGLGGLDMRLSKLSLQHLHEMQLKFCTDDSRYSASSNSGGPEDFYCP